MVAMDYFYQFEMAKIQETSLQSPAINTLQELSTLNLTFTREIEIKIEKMACRVQKRISLRRKLHILRVLTSSNSVMKSKTIFSQFLSHDFKISM